MGEPSKPHGKDIRHGDQVIRRGGDRHEVGRVAEVMPVYGGWLGGPGAVLFKLAAVSWPGKKKFSLERLADLAESG